jgi:nitronate monooxygenase
MEEIETKFSKLLGIRYPIICGAMFPCSNPELIAAVSEAGGIGIVQPVSMTYVHGHDFREGLQQIKAKTKNPFGMNVLSIQNERYKKKMEEWVEIALDEGCSFFITALGNPKWLVDKVKPHGGIVFHNTTEKKWALKAIDAGIDGFICINKDAGGHAGELSKERLFEELKEFEKPMVLAGGVGDKHAFRNALSLGYDGVQMGTRFIASNECNSHQDYKDAILKAKKEDIVLTEKVDAIPLSVIKTAHVEKVGTKAGAIVKYLLQFSLTKNLVRNFYTMIGAVRMKKTALKGLSSSDYYQAGKSVDGINSIERVADIIKNIVSS